MYGGGGGGSNVRGWNTLDPQLIVILGSIQKYDSVSFDEKQLDAKTTHFQKNVAIKENSFASRATSKVLEIFANMFSLKYMTEIGFQIFNIQRILYYIGLMTISIYLPNMIQLQPDANIDSTTIR